MNVLLALKRMVDDRLQPAYLRMVAVSIIVLCGTIAVLLFATSNRGQTMFGIPLGADFAGFYVAAEILNRGETQQLYDRVLHQRLYHELLPAEAEQVAIPYVHPPFVAGLLRPLAYLPYPVAVAIWQIFSVALYVSGTWLVLDAAGWKSSTDRQLALLLACSFEPFAFECLLGGQLSAVGYFSFALYYWAISRSHPFWAGLGFGLSFYKPTLLLLVLPMLFVGRRWKVLGGMTVTGILLVGISLLLVGWTVNVGYLSELLSFGRSTSGGDLEIRNWKYVDLNNCLRLLLGASSPFQLPLLALIGLVPFFALARAWWKSSQSDDNAQDGLWSTTLIWVPVLNLYFGIYDSIIVVQAALISLGEMARAARDSQPWIRSGMAYLLALIYLAPWFSQRLALAIGVSVYTLLLMVWGARKLTHTQIGPASPTVASPIVAPAIGDEPA